MPRVLLLSICVACSLGASGTIQAEEDSAGGNAPVAATGSPTAAAAIVEAVGDPALKALLEETLDRNPELRSGLAEIRAAAWRAERAGGLPEMTAAVTAFLETPETRVGPQRLMATVGQSLPWSGKRALAAASEAHAADAIAAAVEADRLELVTEVRRLHGELGFVLRLAEITESFRRHLLRHEEIARASYETGRGTSQGVLKMQAEITRVDRRLLEIETRRVSLVSRLNELRGRSTGDEVPFAVLEAPRRVALDGEAIAVQALDLRPELQAADARLVGVETQAELERRRSRPDFRVGLTYTVVDDRRDRPGQLQPPPDNGKDIFGISGGITIPLWRKQRVAGLEEALERRSVEEARRTATVNRIRARVGDLVESIRLTWREIRLLEDLLIVQAEEALESAQAAYVAGTLNALELFDAEHVLFEAETAVARARADYQIALAELEGAVGAPIGALSGEETS